MDEGVDIFDGACVVKNTVSADVNRDAASGFVNDLFGIADGFVVGEEAVQVFFF